MEYQSEDSVILDDRTNKNLASQPSSTTAAQHSAVSFSTMVVQTASLASASNNNNNSATTGTFDSSYTGNLDAASSNNNMMGDSSSLMESGVFHDGTSSGDNKKKKKKKDKKKKTKSRSRTFTASAAAISVGETSGVLSTSDDILTRASTDGIETVWGHDNEWNDEDWNTAPKNKKGPNSSLMYGTGSRSTPTSSSRGSTARQSVKTDGSSSGGFTPRQPTSQEFALNRNTTDGASSPPHNIMSAGFCGRTAQQQDAISLEVDDSGIMSDLQSFVDENMSVLTGDNDNYQFSSSSHHRNLNLPTADDNMTTFSSANPEQVPHELLVNYMMAMGANRERAEHLSHTFTAEQQQMQNHANTAANGRHVRPAAVTLSSKLRDAERGNHPSFQYSGSDLRSVASYSITDQQPTRMNTSNPSTITGPRTAASSSFTASISASKIVEAMPVKEFESELPIVYADTTPLSLKYLIHERAVRGALCLVLLIVIGAVIGTVLYLTVLKPDNDGGTGSLAGGTAMPSTSPSTAPTFISDEILEAAGKLSGWDVLGDITSPQLRAVGWMSAIDQMDTGRFDGQKFAQRYALIVMYFSLHGEDWINKEQWLTPDMHECDWSNGIFCQFDETTSRVITGFDATRNNLQGTLPHEIGILTDAESFRIPKNHATGSIPDAIGKMTSLSVVELSDNELTGAIPATFDGARNIILLDLSQNQLSATIPTELYNLGVLRTLVLHSNKLSGPVSESLTKLSSLVTLDLRQNMITGTLPFTLLENIPTLDIILLDHNTFTGALPAVSMNLLEKQTLSLSHNQFTGNLFVLSESFSSVNISDFRLQHVDVSYNKLSGEISPLLSFLPSFRSFDLSGNGFFGAFPSAVGWDKLEYLAMADNAFTGTVPIGYPSLTHLDFSNNQFTEGVPEELCNSLNMEFLILSGNQLEGTIPACLSDLLFLRDLELRNCSLSGSVSTDLGQVEDLAILDLADNLLTSTIPTELGNLLTLERLNLQGNLLTGSIPSEVANIMNLKMLNLTDNDLTGAFPPELEALVDLESLFLRGNSGLGGRIPGRLCGLSTLELSARDIGCGVVCDCCGDFGSVC